MDQPLPERIEVIFLTDKSPNVQTCITYINKLIERIQAYEAMANTPVDQRIASLKASMRAQDRIVDELQERIEGFTTCVRYFIGMLDHTTYEDIFDDPRGHGMRQLVESRDYIHELLVANSKLLQERYELTREKDENASDKKD